VGVAAGRRVEAHWAELTSAGEIDALRGGLRDLLAKLRRGDAPDPAVDGE
jgi:hypothetical protein